MNELTTLQLDILLALRPCGAQGIALEQLLVDMRRGRHAALESHDLLRVVRELNALHYTISFHSPLGAKRWRITAQALSTLDEAGL